MAWDVLDQLELFVMRNNHGVTRVNVLWVCLLNMLSLRQTQGCELSECKRVNSYCATLCEGGEWLDLSDIGAKARFKGHTRQHFPDRAIDDDNKTCSTPVRSHFAFVNRYTQA